MNYRPKNAPSWPQDPKDFNQPNVEVILQQLDNSTIKTLGFYLDIPDDSIGKLVDDPYMGNKRLED